MRTSTLLLACLLAVALLTQGADAGETRFHQYTKQYKTVKNPADPQLASYLGTGGTEWLSGGGFAPAGEIVLGGTSVGPAFDLDDVTITVLGEDADAPSYEPKTRKKRGREITLAPAWDHPNGTGFVVKLDKSGQRILAAARLPWKAGGATDCTVDSSGAVYLAGKVGDNFNSLGEATDVTDAKEENRKTYAYLAKIDPTLKKLLWLKKFADVGKGPHVRIDKKGRIQVEAAWVYAFRPDGGLDEVGHPHKVNKWKRGVNPVDFSYAVGNDYNKHTGREPWRMPFLYVHDAEGEKLHELFLWDPKLVGTDKYRLVSDSTVKHLTYDNDGHLWMVGWSDGGNTVYERHPKDLDKKSPHKGLGFSSWGAGAMSITHLIKIDPTSGEVLDKTLWLGYLSSKNQPSSTSIKHIAVAPDGSILLAGGSAFGLIQTGNNLHNDDMRPGGPFVAVLNKDLDDIRFSSSLNATGKANLTKEEDWNTAVGVVDGRAKALFVTGAVAKDSAYAEHTPAPTVKPVQKGFAGGQLDGWFLVLDLGPAK